MRSAMNPSKQHTIEHTIDDTLRTYFANIKTRRALLKDPVYQQHQLEIERVLQTIVYQSFDRSSIPPASPKPTLSALAWNIERGKRLATLLDWFDQTNETKHLDFVLLTELDIGMGRSANQHVPKVIARHLKMHYVYANHHLVLSKGDKGEQNHHQSNRWGLHGSALLSRFPIRRAWALNIGEYLDKFHAFEKRLGEKRALFCEVDISANATDEQAATTLGIIVVHLDPFSPPAFRANQLSAILKQTIYFSADINSILIGGDFNTTTFNLSNGLNAAMNLAKKLVVDGKKNTLDHYLHPYRQHEKLLFDYLLVDQFDFLSFNELAVPTVSYSLNDPLIKAKTLQYIPEQLYTSLSKWLSPYDRAGLKLDWFAAKGLHPFHTAVLASIDSLSISDHAPIYLQFAPTTID